MWEYILLRNIFVVQKSEAIPIPLHSWVIKFSTYNTISQYIDGTNGYLIKTLSKMMRPVSVLFNVK